MKKDYILSIDAGTTSIRSVIFDRQGRIITKVIKKVPQLTSEAGGLEQDANGLYDIVQTAIADVLINAHLTAKQLITIAIANQRETTIIWNKKTGQPIHHAIAWRSNQTQDIINTYKNQLDEQLIHEKTGLRLDPIFSASKIRFILDHTQNGQQRAENGELLFGTVNTWLVWKLSHGEVFKTDPTNASRTLLFNLQTGTWDDELLQLFDIPKALLPEIIANDVVIGTVQDPHSYAQGVTIAAMLGSQQAALIGQTAFDDGMVKATLGSGGFIVMNTGTKPHFSSQNLLTSVGYQLNQQTHYVLEGGILTAGDAIDWFTDQLHFLTQYQEADTLAQQSKNEDELYFIPAFNGLAAPYWDPDVRGAFLGLTRGSTRADLVKAGLQAIAYQTADILTSMRQDTQLAIPKLHVDGGATNSPYLLQFIADITQIPVQLSKNLETTALGAAMIAGLNMGIFKDMAQLKLLNSEKQTFEPNLDDETRKRLYHGWHQAVRAAQIFE